MINLEMLPSNVADRMLREFFCLAGVQFLADRYVKPLTPISIIQFYNWRIVRQSKMKQREKIERENPSSMKLKFNEY